MLATFLLMYVSSDPMYVESPGSQPSSSPHVSSVESVKVGHTQHSQSSVAEFESQQKKPRIEGLCYVCNNTILTRRKMLVEYNIRI